MTTNNFNDIVSPNEFRVRRTAPATTAKTLPANRGCRGSRTRGHDGRTVANVVAEQIFRVPNESVCRNSVQFKNTINRVIETAEKENEKFFHDDFASTHNDGTLHSSHDTRAGTMDRAHRLTATESEGTRTRKSPPPPPPRSCPPESAVGAANLRTKLDSALTRFFAVYSL